MARLVGVDVGGTFTDLVVLDEEANRLVVAKVPTTPDDQSAGVARALEESGVAADSLAAVIHGTTVGTNMLLQRRGARCGLLATYGFRDLLELRRRDRPMVYGLEATFEPLVSRDRCVEVGERTRFDGTVARLVSKADMALAVKHLQGASVEIVVVSFLHSYANPTNERAARSLINELWPDVPVVLGSDIAREWREFERTSTAVASAYIQPGIERYLTRLQGRLSEKGFQRELLVVQSNGGIMSARAASAEAAKTVLSGPAAGVTAATQCGLSVGLRNLISLDMGGTSCDVALIADGVAMTRDQVDLEFGVRLRLPMLDITTIGAGGGSIAWIDRGGVLQVGPQSAGAWPGPACYGAGGTAPTVTDANVVLGWLRPDRTLGSAGGPSLAEHRAVEAITAEITQPLGMADMYEAADAIRTVVNARMVEQIRSVSVRRGHDPREFILVAFGGAGPLHAADLAREAGLGGALIVPHPGITSAIGCVTADVRHDFVQTVNQPLELLDLALVRDTLNEQRTNARRLLADEAIPIVAEELEHLAEMEYEGQTHTIRVPLPLDRTPSRDELHETFEAAYAREYGQTSGRAARVVNLRTVCRGIRPQGLPVSVAPRQPARTPKTAMSGGTKIRLYSDRAHRTGRLYDRAALGPGTDVIGPAVIEQTDSTTAVPHGMRAVADPMGNLMITVIA